MRKIVKNRLFFYYNNRVLLLAKTIQNELPKRYTLSERRIYEI
nr:MAG TPA: hypothetical protein [Caudoviricetes sp.]